MNPLPPLTDEEYGRLRKSVEQDGVRGNPVLLDRSGKVIDGHHRRKVAAELGIEWPTETLDVDDETADRLRIMLNVARRHLDTLTRYELIAETASRHEAVARAEAKERQREHGGTAPGKTLVQAAGTSVPKGKARDQLAARINNEFEALGVDFRVSGVTIETARLGAALPEETKQLVRKGDLTASDAIKRHRRRAPKGGAVGTGTLRGRPDRKEAISQMARIRAIDAEHQYRSMLNAPVQKLNLPLIRRAEKIMELLTELIALDPAKAVTQLPIERCRDFTVAHAAWWSDFARLCEERRAAETPDLLPRPFRPVNAVLNPVVLGSSRLPAEERALTPRQRAVLDWIRAQDEPITATQVAVGLRNRSRQVVRVRLQELTLSGLIEVVGKIGSENAYRARGDTEPGETQTRGNCHSDGA